MTGVWKVFGGGKGRGRRGNVSNVPMTWAVRILSRRELVKVFCVHTYMYDPSRARQLLHAPVTYGPKLSHYASASVRA